MYDSAVDMMYKNTNRPL